MTDALNIRLDDLDPDTKRRLLIAIGEAGVALWREGRIEKATTKATAIQLLIDALAAMGYAVRDNQEVLPKSVSEPPAGKQAAKARRK